MQQDILNHFKNHSHPHGFSAKEIQEQLQLTAPVKEINSALSALKKSGELVTEKKRYFHRSSRPDLLNKTQAGEVLDEYLVQYKADLPVSYPPTLPEFHQWVESRLPIDASQLSTWISKSNAKVILTHYPAKNDMVLLPKSDLKVLITPEWIRKLGTEILQKTKENTLSKYPMTQAAFTQDLIKQLKKAIKGLAIKPQEIKPYITDNPKWCLVSTGSSKKVCFRGHEKLANPPKGDELKKILLEWLELKKGEQSVSYSESISIQATPVEYDPRLENLFLETHARLDREGMQDRAVPIPKLWRVLQDRMSRETFERILGTLAHRRQFQLEQRSTLDGLSEEELNACYQKGEKRFYLARRLS